MSPVAAHPPKIEPDPIRRRIPGWIWPVGMAGLGVLWLVKTVQPAGQIFFPRCWLHQMTGLQCPGCGATRALHALLNGHWEQAFHYNALLVMALPVVVWMAVRGFFGWWTGRWWRNPVSHPAVIAALAGLVVGFGLARNVF
ncbi:MAG TPA: DUF2752 domain-containing protein [Verrucomicrobiota bacterium]|nr:DUF2752 domain-containing protein [Verrucomicrobiota bacterium]